MQAMTCTLLLLALFLIPGTSQASSTSDTCTNSAGCADDTNLLQRQPGMQPPDGDHALSSHFRPESTSAVAIEKSILSLAQDVISGREPLTDNTKALLKGVDGAMETIIAGAPKEHQLFQADVDRAKDEIETCGATTRASHSKTGGVDALAAKVGSERSAHISCREDEKPLHLDKIEKCKHLDNFVAGLQAPSCFGNTVSQMSLDAFENCGESLRPFFADNAKTWAAKSALCNDATSAHSTKRAECESKQARMEIAFCEYASVLSETCSAQEACRATQIGFRSKVHEDVKTAEAALKAEYQSARNVRCVIKVFDATDAEKPAKLDNCKSAIADTSKLDVTYHSDPEAASCDPSPVSSKPCDDNWVRQEFAGQAWAADAPAHACLACADRAAMTTAAPTTAAPRAPTTPAPSIWRPVLTGTRSGTGLTGTMSGGFKPVTLTADLGNNVWILVAFDDPFYKMTKIKITGATTSEYIATRYEASHKFPAACKVQATFTEACFCCQHGSTNPKGDYPVQLKADSTAPTTITVTTTAAGPKPSTWRPILADTKLTGTMSGGQKPAILAADLGDNVWILAAFDDPFYKMTKIKITGASTSEYIATRYEQSHKFPDACKVPESFKEECFCCQHGSSNPKGDYPVDLAAEQV